MASLPLLVWERLLKESTEGTSAQYHQTVRSTFGVVRSARYLPQKNTSPKDHAFDIPFLMSIRDALANRILLLESVLNHDHPKKAQQQIIEERSNAIADSLFFLGVLTERLYALGAID